LTVLKDVVSRIDILSPGPGTWAAETFPGSPELGTISIVGTNPLEDDEFFFDTSGYLQPSTYSRAAVFGGVEQLRQAPSFFDGAGLTVNQYFATSADGTKVPYFVVGQRDKPAPTLLYGYGGFEISLTPGYSGGMGRSWLANGGTYVVANARGGGEYGPTWHTSVLKENRFKVYEDFAAVAQDLVDRGITTARQLAFQGGSNGGLTAGVLYTRYPELFGAIVCQVPLLDMKRYSHLLAGASWMAEYGNPDDPTEWGHISKYSPYHNLRDDVAYPPILFTTSTRDDRVHPAHARKMAAKLQSHNQKVYYYENLEGGHGGAADNKQSAHATSLSWEFLLQNL
jgi:prolyl oligopeptidase